MFSFYNPATSRDALSFHPRMVLPLFLFFASSSKDDGHVDGHVDGYGFPVHAQKSWTMAILMLMLIINVR
jgi:hypothetical protein